MRPILLKIKGLNSFIEEQTIDFKRLMEPGLFGIFGPTGSGKTTILDGITLALYGEIARKSKNFINANCKSASVLFEFQISGAETKMYRVEREFRKDPNKEGYKTGKCRISDLTGEEPVILADKVKDVNNCCIDIIGLKLDDFQRTVVLPQGRFSEFLKLEGSKRSEMLERLFRLQPYGDELMRKIKDKNEEISHNKSNLEGQLTAYGDISEEKVKESKKEVEELEVQAKEKQVLLQDTQKEYQAGKVIWDLQQEQQKYIEEKNSLEAQADEIARLEEGLLLSQRAGRVYPFIESLISLENETKEKELQIVTVRADKEASEARKNELEKVWESWKNCWSEELPELRTKVQNLLQAIRYQTEYFRLKDKESSYQAEKQQMAGKLELAKKQEAEHEKNIEDNNKKIEELRERQKKYEISADLRQQIQAGTVLEQQVNFGAQRIRQEEEGFQRIKAESDKILESIQTLHQILFSEDSPKESQADLSKYQSDLYALREKKKLLTEVSEQAEAKEKEYLRQEKDFEALSKQKAVLENTVVVARQKKEQLETEALSAQLREKLVTGEPCPVCGSVHHNTQEIHVFDLSLLESVRMEFDNAEKEKMEVEKQLFVISGSLENTKEELSQLRKKRDILEEETGSVTNEQIAERLQALPEYQSAQTSYSMLSKTVKEKEENLAHMKEEQEKQEAQLAEKLKKVSFSSFQEAAQRLQSCDQALEKIQQNLKLGMDITEHKRKEYEEVQKERISLEKALAVVDGNIQSTAEQKKNIIAQFAESTADYNFADIEDRVIGETLRKAQLREQQIEEEYRKSEESKEQETKRFLALNGTFLEINSALEVLKKRIVQEEARVEELLKAEQFPTREACMNALLAEDELSYRKAKIESYKNELTQNAGVLKRLEEQLDGRNISKEQWDELERKKTNMETAYEELKLTCSNKRQNYEIMVNQWERQKTLLIQMKKIEHKQSLMNELMQLFRGKKFVEYVALSKLQYISRAASYRLREISNGNYGLEVDAAGRFMICDYKNGGVKRDAFTLSGGETFLVSLSLSLALSEQVQLKGTAPLELFFLDEGFGTLDEELLEVVMTSLEKIQNKHLTVGIISHVESVKNRVPIKLIVSPSVSGMGGTKVHIEKN